jgi:ferric-dicitrate binding protein FerR (iron transport regulator)
MADFMDRFVTARDYVSPQWTAEREVRVRVGIERTRRARARRRSALAVGALSIAAAIALYIAQRGPFARSPVASTPTKTSQPASLFRLPDGSSVSPRSADARVQPVEVSARAVTLKLESGAAKFSVTPDPARPFRVLARDVTVTVLGTIFDVAFEGTGVARLGQLRSRSTCAIASSREWVSVSSEPVAPRALNRTPAPP